MTKLTAAQLDRIDSGVKHALKSGHRNPVLLDLEMCVLDARWHRAEVNRLTVFMNAVLVDANVWKAERAKARAEIERLREALKPFADIALNLD